MCAHACVRAHAHTYTQSHTTTLPPNSCDSLQGKVSLLCTQQICICLTKAREERDISNLTQHEHSDEFSLKLANFNC